MCIPFQVEDVDKKFADLQKCREGGWVRESPKQVKKVIKVSQACLRFVFFF